MRMNPFELELQVVLEEPRTALHASLQAGVYAVGIVYDSAGADEWLEDRGVAQCWMGADEQ